jgi:hypothetical protein
LLCNDPRFKRADSLTDALADPQPSLNISSELPNRIGQRLRIPDRDKRTDALVDELLHR